MDFSAFPTKATPQFPKIKSGDANRGESITAFSGRKRVLALLFFLVTISPSETFSFFPLHRKRALTKNFVLSNIRFVSGGSSEMLRTSRCIRIKLLQSGGPRTLSAVASSLYNLSSPSEKYFASWGQSSPPHCGQLEFISETMWNSEPIHFRPRLGRGRRNHNLKGDGRRFRWPLINFED